METVEGMTPEQLRKRLEGILGGKEERNITVDDTVVIKAVQGAGGAVGLILLEGNGRGPMATVHVGPEGFISKPAFSGFESPILGPVSTSFSEALACLEATQAQGWKSGTIKLE